MEKKTSCLLCVLTALLLTVLYLWAALRPGVWLRDAFLYRQADGSFSGKDAYAAYTMQIAQTGNGTEVEFTLDGETRRYRLESKAEGMTGWSFLPGPRWATPATPSCGGKTMGGLPTR